MILTLSRRPFLFFRVKGSGMELSVKQQVRIANRIQGELQELWATRGAKLGDSLDSAVRRLDRLSSIKDKLTVCSQRGWHRAAERLLAEALRMFQDIAFTGDALRRNSRITTAIPSLREILADLAQIDDEFGELKYDGKEPALSVVTEPIELEGVYLGEFEIKLPLNLLGRPGRGPVYEVIALDPHPAVGSDGVTHPHVQDDTLCAGDAGAAIDTALSTGRLCDFFLLVRSVLAHYNADSPYVTLERWEGVPCADCGYTVNEDDSFFCHLCDCTLCEGCASSCYVCEETTCGGCLRKCPVCEDAAVCESCFRVCPECGNELCRLCLEEDQCPCRNEEEEDVREEAGEVPGSGEQPTASDGTASGQDAVQSDRVGQPRG